uniref:Uncharacterized protein n=1 Tax=Cannabis sativa TaxID=3483 RepID=A0A803QYY8_CANSA
MVSTRPLQLVLSTWNPLPFMENSLPRSSSRFSRNVYLFPRGFSKLQLLTITRVQGLNNYLVVHRFHFHHQLTTPPRLPGVAVHHVPQSQIPADNRLEHVVAPPKHPQYVPQITLRTPMHQQRYVIKQPALPHNAALYQQRQESYLPQNSSSNLQDPYLRYIREFEMVHRPSAVEYASGYAIPQLPQQGENEDIPKSNYVAEYGGQHLPTTTSHISFYSHSLPQSITPSLPPAHGQVELPVFHEPYYPTSIRDNPSQIYNDPLQRLLPGSSRANAAAPSHVSFVGAAPTYR